MNLFQRIHHALNESPTHEIVFDDDRKVDYLKVEVPSYDVHVDRISSNSVDLTIHFDGHPNDPLVFDDLYIRPGMDDDAIVDKYRGAIEQNARWHFGGDMGL